MDSGVQVQVNADILSQRLRGSMWRSMLADGEIWAVGSDIHGVHTGYKYWKYAKRIAGNGWNSMMEKLQSAV